MPSEWYVITKTGQVVASVSSVEKPDLSVFYEHPELYDAVLNPPQTALESFYFYWSNDLKGERRAIGA